MQSGTNPIKLVSSQRQIVSIFDVKLGHFILYVGNMQVKQRKLENEESKVFL